MDDLDTIKKRIEETGRVKKKSRHPLYKIMMSLLIVLSITLGCLIYARIDENGLIINQVFNTNVNFTNFNQKINKILDRMFNFNIYKNDNDQEVNASAIYLKSERDNYYYVESNLVPMLKNGIISYIDIKDSKAFIMINYENGVVASYFDLLSPLVKVMDQLKAGESIAEYEQSFKVIFQKDHQIIDYEEALL